MNVDNTTMDVAYGGPGNLKPYVGTATSKVELPRCAPVGAESDIGEQPATTPTECNLRDSSGSCDDAHLSLPSAMQPLARHPKCRSHYGGLLYHHRFPSAGRTKRKVLWASPPATADSSAQECIGGGKIRVSEERVSRQLQQLRLVGAAAADGQPSSTLVAVEPAEPQQNPAAVAGGLRESDASSTAASSGRRTGSVPLSPGLRVDKSSSLEVTTDTRHSLALASAVPTAAPSGRHSPISWSWAKSRDASADDEISIATSTLAVVSPPVVVWQTEGPQTELPASDAELPVLQPPPVEPACLAVTLMHRLECPIRDGSLLTGSFGKAPGLQVPQSSPMLQVPPNPVERSGSPPPSALVNPDEEGVCVVLSVNHCLSVPNSMEH